MAEPQITVTLTGSIGDFTRLDNLYKSMKREAQKLFKDWQLKIDLDYTETEKG